MGRKHTDDEPTLAEAWATLGQRLGLTVEERGERSIRAHGTVRGRAVEVDIEGEAARSEFGRFLAGLNTISSRNRREKWRTVVTVGVTNPARVTGSVTSAVDVNDPAWNPREYNPRNGRQVVADPPSLAERVLTAESHELLMSIMDEIRVEVQPTFVRIDDSNTAIPGSGANYVAGSFLHHYQGSVQPWPERALVGPPWWLNLLCDLADTLDRAQATHA